MSKTPAAERGLAAAAVALVLLAGAGCSGGTTATTRATDTARTEPAPRPAVASPTPPAHPDPSPGEPHPYVYPPEATACRDASECERAVMPTDGERAGGPCCSVCAGYVALNRAWHAREPACDSATRGACGVSCAEGRPPPVACEAGRCVLTYPPVEATCRRDSDCVTVPKLVPGAPPDGCRLACGQYVAGSRDWDAWAASLWENTSVTGPCPGDCVDRPLPAAACVSGRCTLRAPTVIALTRVDLREPTVSGSLPSDLIAGVVAAHASDFTTCRERPRSIDPIGYAGFEVSFVIGVDGRATGVRAGELGDHLPDVAACIARVIGGLQFPRPRSQADVLVQYPMGAAFETR